MSEIKLRKINFENKCITVEALHLASAALNARIDSIAVTLMERRVG
jgi:hypothetical protein